MWWRGCMGGWGTPGARYGDGCVRWAAPDAWWVGFCLAPGGVGHACRVPRWVAPGAWRLKGPTSGQPWLGHHAWQRPCRRSVRGNAACHRVGAWLLLRLVPCSRPLLVWGVRGAGHFWGAISGQPWLGHHGSTHPCTGFMHGNAAHVPSQRCSGVTSPRAVFATSANWHVRLCAWRRCRFARSRRRARRRTRRRTGARAGSAWRCWCSTLARATCSSPRRVCPEAPAPRWCIAVLASLSGAWGSLGARHRCRLGSRLAAQESFAAISNRLIVGPVVETLVYSKVPGAVSQTLHASCRCSRGNSWSCARGDMTCQ